MKEAVEEYLRLVRESVDPDAWLDDCLNIHFDELDEQTGEYIPTTVSPDKAERKVLEMYDLGGC